MNIKTIAEFLESNQNPEIYAIFSITVSIVFGIIVAYSFKKLF